MNPLNQPPHTTEPIAIIGMSCRFPKAPSLKAFWELLKNGQDTIEEIPKERWDMDPYYDSDLQAEGKTHQRHASLLSDVHDFDPLFFNISPAEATEMSPSQKLMLELAWEAIESASVPFQQVKGGNVGVYVGNIWTDFEHYRKVKNARATLHSAVGMSSNVIANRVSFVLGLTGPSLVIDTGCSASLVALHLACQSLLTRESQMAMVGGINHILDPGKYIELTRFGGLSLKGRCSTFDSDADGFVRGEGGGVLLLKRLADAERDGDKVFAVIRGTSVNNNGYNDTLPATSKEGQKTLLANVYRQAGIAPHEVHYIEAHGTGTKLGDPNEATAIGEFFSTGRQQTPLRVGSLKTNIGHTEATAGIAGLIKVVLAMQERMLPPNLHFNNPNPNIPFDALKLEVQQSLSSWPVQNGETLKAGVNSFGWGGTNAHAVLEEYRAKKPATQKTTTSVARFCLPISAKSAQALKDYVKLYLHRLTDVPAEEVYDVCVAAALRKATFDHRVVFAGATPHELLAALNTFVEDDTEVVPCVPMDASARLVFVFPGQGAQWLGMGRELMAKENVFREAIEACDRAFAPYTDWSLIAQLNATPETSRLQEIDVVQPALCAMQLALAKLWKSWGITPHAVVGHSMGEVAAAYTAGAISLEDAARIICERSRLMKTVSGQGGAMAVTELSREEAEKIAETYQGKFSVAVNNSPKSTVLAGDKAAIEEVLQKLDADGLFCRMVKVDVASHSPQMDPLMAPLREALQGMKPQPSHTPFFSTVRNQRMEGTLLDADYWVSNLRGTVQFAAVMDQLLQDEHTVFIEANPHPVLVNAVHECAGFVRKRVLSVGSLQRDNPELPAMMHYLSELYSKGYEVDWGVFFGTTHAPVVDLPLYPFQRERYELEDLSHILETGREKPVRYPLLGQRINLAHSVDSYYWESSITLEKFPFLREHRVQSMIELPVSCLMEMMLEAATEVYKNETPTRISDLVIHQYVTMPEQARITLQLKFTLLKDSSATVSIYKQAEDGGTWEVLAQATIGIVDEDPAVAEMFEKLEYRAPRYTEGVGYYRQLRSLGMEYGTSFQQITGLDEINSLPDPNVLYSLHAGQSVRGTAEKYRIHPALSTSFMQAVYRPLAKLLNEGDYLDVHFTRMEQLTCQDAVHYDRELRAFAVFHKMPKALPETGVDKFLVDITVANYDNTLVMKMMGVEGSVSRKAAPRKGQGGAAGEADFITRYSLISEDENRLKALEQLVTQHVSQIIKIAPQRIKPTMTFKGMGIDSLMAVQLSNVLGQEIQTKLKVGMFWSHPSIQDYASYLKDLLTGATFNSAEKQASPAELWFTIPAPNPAAAVRLFCFHDAGGSAALFDGWEHHLSDNAIELVLVEMPGRGRRLEESPYVDCSKFIEDFVPLFKNMLDKPYIMLGHSMGGLLAFEVMRALRKQQAQLPFSLFISSTAGLTAYEKRQVDYAVSKEELIRLYPHLELKYVGTEEMQDLLVNILRADLQFLHSYQYQPEDKFELPIIAIHGNDDERVTRLQMTHWEAETAAEFQLLDRPGGHRYLQHDGTFVTGLLWEFIEAFLMKSKTEPTHV